MHEHLRYQRVILGISAATTVVGAAGLLLCAPAHREWAFGFAFGGLMGLIWLRLKVAAVLVLLSEGADRSPAACAKSAFQSYALLAVTLLVAFFLRDTLSPWTALAGLMVPRAVLISDSVFRPGAALPVEPVQDGQAHES